MVQIKTPPCYDISRYETVWDFSRISPQPVLIITKATEGTAYIDPKFEEYMGGMQDAGIRRGCYHFHRKAADPFAQADHFVETIFPKVTTDDILVLDVEEGGETAAQLIAFIQRVQEYYPDNLFMIYSRKNLLDPIIMTDAQQHILSQIPIWTAGYPYDPDKYIYPPDHYIPDQSKWGPVWLWQYSDKGVVAGIDGNVDLNWCSAYILDWLGEQDSDHHESWFAGKVEYISGYRQQPRPFYFHITKFLRSDVKKLHVPGLGFLGTSVYAWNTREDPALGKADIVINGDEGHYDRSPMVPKAIGVSDGTIFKTETQETSVQWDSNHRIIGIGWEPLPGVYNACGGSADLLLDGVVPDRIKDDPWVDPRTGIFWNDTHYFLVHIDGRNNGTEGLRKDEFAEFGLALGARWGRNNDGGDSCQLLYNDNGHALIKNNPPDGSLHSVVNHVLFWIDKGSVEPPPGGSDMDKRVIKTTRRRVEPNFFADPTPGHMDAEQGYEFVVQSESIDTQPVPDANHTVMWYLDEHGWIPNRHHTNSDIYLEDIQPEPPPTDNLPFVLDVVGYKPYSGELEPDDQ